MLLTNATLRGWGGRGITLSAILLFFSFSASAAEILWTGGDATDAKDWFRPANWNLGRVPAEGDDVCIAATGTLNTALWYINLTNSTPHLKSLKLEHGNPSYSPHWHIYLTFKNWSTKLWADDIHVKKGAMLTAENFTNAQMSNRVWIAGVNLTLDYYNWGWKSYYKTLGQIKDGTIYMTGCGYQAGYGPGWASGKSSGGGYGGAYGGKQGMSGSGAPTPYGSAAYPYDPGCGSASSTGHGGGAIFIDLTGTLKVDGSILAGGYEINGISGGGGSGGGILINCQKVIGKGYVMADAHHGQGFSLPRGRAGGSGGRIAVHYDPVAQTNAMADCTVTFSARAGGSGCNTPITHAENGYGVTFNPGDPGTLWFPDELMMRRAQPRLNGVLANVSANSEFAFDGNLALSSALFGFSVPVKLSVAGDLNIVGEGSHCYGLWFSDRADVRIDGNASVRAAWMKFANGGSLSVGGGLTLTNASSSTWYTGGELDVCGSSEGAMGEAGMTVDVGRLLAVHKLSVIDVRAHPTSGSVVRFTARNATFTAGSAVDGWGRGYPATKGPGYEGNAGASHAGEGSPTNGVAKTYGDRLFPTAPGSGSNVYAGGSVFWLEVARTLTANGDVSVHGQQPWPGTTESSYHGGSGGSLLLKAGKFVSSSGVLDAAGGTGNGTNGSYGGGGGRVAIYARHFETNGTFSVTVAGGASIKNGAAQSCGPAGDGTLYLRKTRAMCVILR